MVEKVIGKSGVVLSVIHAVIIAVLPQMLDAYHAAQIPLLADVLLRHPLGHHVHMDALRRFAASEVGHDPHIRVGVLQAADEIVPQPLGLLKGMYLVLVGKGEGAV